MKKLQLTAVAINVAIVGIMLTIRWVTDFEMERLGNFSPGFLSLCAILGFYGLGYISPQFPIFALFEWQRQREKWQREVFVVLSPVLAVIGVILAIFGLLALHEILYLGLAVFNFSIAYHISVEKNGIAY